MRIRYWLALKRCTKISKKYPEFDVSNWEPLSHRYPDISVKELWKLIGGLILTTHVIKLILEVGIKESTWNG